ncbi:MAG: hypothetical protein ACRD0A_01755, partial [Acidimicrobiales bacterium]
MSEARRVLVGLICATAGWLLGIPGVSPTPVYDYDGARAIQGVLLYAGHTASEKVTWGPRASAADASSGYDDPATLPRAVARSGDYRSAP